MATKPICPICGSGQVYNRIATSDNRCRKCGHVWKVEQATKEEKE